MASTADYSRSPTRSSLTELVSLASASHGRAVAILVALSLFAFLPGFFQIPPIDREEVCLYTVAPDDEFLVGPLPGRSDVIVASPCSGHGFKFAALIGRILADLARSGGTDLDIAAWAPAGLRAKS